MKKVLVLSLVLLLTACACNGRCCKNPRLNGTCGCRSGHCQKNKTAETPVVEATPVAVETAKPAVRTEITPVMYEGNVVVDKPETAAVIQEIPQPVVTESVVMPEPQTVVVPAAVVQTPCAKAGQCVCEPVILKPRVTETVGKKRPCCDDGEDFMSDNAETYVPDAPEIYVIAANRTVNSMQDEAAALFEQIGKIKVYVDKATPKSEDLPGGMDKGTETIRKRFSQMKNVTVVDNKFAADYSVSSAADWYDTPTKTVPAIKYDVSFKDRGGNLIGEWSEIIHQADGDRSWW